MRILRGKRKCGREMALIPVSHDPASPLPSPRYRPGGLAVWLVVVAAMVVLMVAIGGITRLTESGLSITEWKPVTGALPPLSEAQWQAEFAAYQQIGEYQQVSGPAGMTLADYKFIYFWEWAHRLLGRVIGLAFAAPLAWFWLRGAIPPGYKLRLLALLALGGLQGVFGWFMVRSGLSTEMTDVSHFWLSIHLMTAFFTLAGLSWTALDLRELRQTPGARPARLTGIAAILALILAVQLLFGAWVAGLNAGHASDSWPLMNDRLVPEMDWSRGFWWTFLHDPFWLHFMHRWWAFIAFGAVMILARIDKREGHLAISRVLHSLVGVQILLGIATVVSGVSVWIAVLHQLTGALLVIAFTWGAHVPGRRVVAP